MKWQERQKEWEIVVSLQKARIAEMEKMLRSLVCQWEECEKLRGESGEEEAEYISIPVQNKAMRHARKVLDHE